MDVNEFFTTSGGKGKVWVDFISYANRLFSGGREDLWSNPDTFISVYSQGQGLIKSDVLSIPIKQAYTDFLQREKDVAQPWMGKRPKFALKKLLQLEEPKKFLNDTLTGLHNLYQGAQPLVLVLPSSQSWLQWMHEIVRPDEDVAISEDDIEAASMYLAEFLREFSTLGLSAVVISEADSPTVKLSEALPLYQPIFNVIKHYQWLSGLELDCSAREIEDLTNETDFNLFSSSEFMDLIPLWEKGLRIGGGLGQKFWIDSINEIEKSQTGLAYGKIPEDAKPESVLERLQMLRA